MPVIAGGEALPRKRSCCSPCCIAVLVLAAALAALLFMLYPRDTEPAPPPARGLRVVEIDLDKGYRVEPVLAENRTEGDLFPEMMTRLRPYAAINGTFYDPEKRPLGDVVIGGRLVNRGHYRTAVAVTDDGKVVFRHRSGGRFDWSGYTAGLAAGPRLVHNGKIACDPVADGFGPGSVTLEASRSGVGITADNRLILATMTKAVTLRGFAQIMLDHGCVEAMNLDGGGACGLYRDGKILTLPGMPMAGILAVFEK